MSVLTFELVLIVNAARHRYLPRPRLLRVDRKPTVIRGGGERSCEDIVAASLPPPPLFLPYHPLCRINIATKRRMPDKPRLVTHLARKADKVSCVRQ